MIQLNFPVNLSVSEVLSDTDMNNVLAGFNIKKEDIVYTGRTIYDLFIEITANSFKQLKVMDFGALVQIGGRGVLVTCVGDPMNVPATYDFSNRWFGPK